MAKVEARKGESGEKLLQRFKRIVNKEGILKELKKRARYEKPSEKRRREQKERIRALRKAERKSREGYVSKEKSKQSRERTSRSQE